MRAPHLRDAGMTVQAAQTLGCAGESMENASHNAMHQHRHEGDEYRRIEMITGTVRRRRRTAAEKAALVAESLQPAINVSALARRRGVSRGLLQTWRRTAVREATVCALLARRCSPASTPAARARCVITKRYRRCSRADCLARLRASMTRLWRRCGPWLLGREHPVSHDGFDMERLSPAIGRHRLV
jgi:transposase-like protein